MTMLVGVGASNQTDSVAALSESLERAIQPLQGKEPSFFMVLASPTVYNQQEVIRHVNNSFPNAVTIGCSTSGEITTSGPSDNSLAVMAIYSDQIEFIPGVGHDISQNPRAAGKQFANSIREKKNGEVPQTALILPDGLAGNGADIVRGILDVFGQSFKLAGGSAGDDFLFKQTYQYNHDSVISDSVVGVGLYGNFSFGIGVRHGWIPIGATRKVTKSKGSVLYELNGKPAIQIYEDQFGKDKVMVSQDEPLARLAITYPLGIVVPGKDEYLVRDPITVSDDGAITCAAEVPEGSEVLIMIGSTEEAISAASAAAETAVAQVQGKTVKAVFLFNCIARKKLLMDKKQEEIDKIKEVIGHDVPLIGFYTYGEQAPYGAEMATCSFHNETDVIFVLAE